MSPWFALLVPILGAVVMLLLFTRKVLWWELLIPIAATAIVIFISKACVTTALTDATEYRGSIITKARYTEYWETYVHRTCTRTVDDGKGKSHTETYDCSYCDEHPEHWDAWDAYGHSYSITKAKFESLARQWGVHPQFVNMHRDIDSWGICGKNGDAYDISWTGDVNTADAAVFTHHYKNRPQAAKSAFHYDYISHDSAKALGLYDYPEQFDCYRQTAILGASGVVRPDDLDRVQRRFEYFDGYYGQHKHIKLFVLIFYDKPLDIAADQESYWSGGNDNELVVCIGVSRSTGKLRWVKAFSWCISQRPVIDCREDIMADTTFKADSIYNAIERTVTVNFKPRNLDKDFAYLDVELPTWSIILIFILAIATTIGTSWWTVKNDYDYDNPSGGRYRNYRY